MYSSDYPHWHATDAQASGQPALPTGLPDDLARKIMGANARTFYRL